MKIALMLTLIIAMVSPLIGAAGGEDGLPFSISIRARQERVQALHDVFLDVTLTNTSGKMMTIAGLPAVEAYRVEMTGPDGQATPLTDIGKAIMKNVAAAPKQPESNKLDMRGYLDITLLARQTFQDGYGLSEIFDMTTPGVYFVKLRREVPANLGSGEVESNKVEITITYNPVVEKYGRYK